MNATIRSKNCLCCGEEFQFKRPRDRVCSKSCGSKLGWQKRDRANPNLGRKEIHGMTGTPTHNSWLAMRGRCLTASDPAYKNYGGRGVSICKEWDEFSVFFHDMGERPAGSSIDRIDNNLGYSAENCRWSTPSQQAKNRRSTRLLTFNGETMCLADWARRSHIPEDTLRARLDKWKWPLATALTKPLGARAVQGRPLTKTDMNRVQWRPE